MARILKIESDSSFQLSQVLEGTFLTYKTYLNGRIVHKAKLADGNVVEISGGDFKYRLISQTTQAVNKDFLICNLSLQVKLPALIQGNIIGISTGHSNITVAITANEQEKIQVSSDSLVPGLLLTQKLSTVILFAKTDRWIIAAGVIQPINVEQVQQLLQDYYTKILTDEKFDSIASSSTILAIYVKFEDYYTKTLIDDKLALLSNSFSFSLSNYYTKTLIDIISSGLTDTLGTVYTSLVTDYYTSSQVNLISAALIGFITDKVDKPGNNISNGYVLTKTQGGTSWGPVATGTSFVSSNYYTSSLVNSLLSSYYTSVQINAISSGLNNEIESRMYSPVNTGSTGNILIKTATGTSWGGSVYTGDTFSSANYYTSDLIDGIISGLSDSLHTKLTAPTSGNEGDVLIKTSDGTSWGSIADGGTKTWTTLTIPSTGAVVIDPTSGALQKFSMTRNIIMLPPTLTAAYNLLTLQVACHSTSNYILSKGAILIIVGLNLLFTWYYDGTVTRELPTIYLGK